MVKFFLLLMTFYVINSHTVTSQNWNWIPQQSQFITGNQFGLIENIHSSISPPAPPPIPYVDLNGSLDSLIDQLNNLISLRNQRRRQIQQWNQSLLDAQTITGLPTSFDEINFDDDPWSVIVLRLIVAIVAVVSKAVGGINLLPLNLLPPA